MPLQSPVLVRRFAAGFAVILGLQAAWILAAELTRPVVHFFPGNGTDAKSAARYNSSAGAAAWIGWPRGDLWTDYAVTANAAVIGEIEDGVISSPSSLNKGASRVAETAAILAPSDARAWLLLAIDNATSPSNAGKALAQLKMSYYTAPYNDELFPLRIQVAARTPHIADEELSSFVEYEIGVVIRHKPSLKPSIASAYRTASPAGHRFFETTLAKLDPKYLAELKAAKP